MNITLITSILLYSLDKIEHKKRYFIFFKKIDFLELKDISLYMEAIRSIINCKSGFKTHFDGQIVLIIPVI